MPGDHRLPDTIAENVSEDSDLETQEKETTINFLKWSDEGRLFTSEAGLMRRVIWHPHIQVITLVVKDGDSRPSVAPGDYDGDDGKDIVGVEAIVPVSLLKIGAEPRKASQHAPIISKRAKRAQGAD